MKKFIATLLTASLMLAGTQAFAQIIVGGGYMNATEKVTGIVGTESLDLNGLYAGAKLQFHLDDALYGLGLAPGAYLDFLFGKKEELHYRDVELQVPLHVTYSYELADAFKVFGFAGPALHLGLVKKSTYKDSGYTNTLNYYSNDYSTTLNRFNLFLGLGAGFEVSEQIQVVLGADFGLLDLYKGDNAAWKRPTQIKIGLNYVL